MKVLQRRGDTGRPTEVKQRSVSGRDGAGGRLTGAGQTLCGSAEAAGGLFAAGPRDRLRMLAEWL